MHLSLSSPLSQGGDRATLRRTVRLQFKQNAGLTGEAEVNRERDGLSICSALLALGVST